MDEYYSDGNDCYDLVRILYKNMGDKIYIYGSLSNPLINGKYMFQDENVTSNLHSYYAIRDGLCLYGKYNSDYFLRMGIGDPHSRKASNGEKLAALSDIYETLRIEFGNPTVFYTTKDDDDGALTLQWCFKNKELELEKFEFDNYFDDANLERVIPIKEGSYNEKYGLPEELVSLVDEDFLKYKNITKDKSLTKKL